MMCLTLLWTIFMTHRFLLFGFFKLYNVLSGNAKDNWGTIRGEFYLISFPNRCCLVHLFLLYYCTVYIMHV